MNAYISLCISKRTRGLARDTQGACYKDFKNLRKIIRTAVDYKKKSFQLYIRITNTMSPQT